MFDYFRRNTKKFQPILWVIIIAFVAFYGVMGSDDRDGPPVAKVNGVNISYNQYKNELMQTENQIRNILKENAEQYLKQINIKEMVINRLVERELMRQVFEETGIKTSDYDLLEKLKTYDVFKDKNGNLDKRQMISILNRNRIDPKDFIAGQKQEIGIDMIRKMLEDCTVVSDRELMQKFIGENEKVEADYVFFSIDSLLKDIQVSDDELNDYYTKNTSKYKVEDSADVEFAQIEINDFMNSAKIADDEVKSYYDSNQDEFKVDDEKVKARHILFRIKPDDNPVQEEAVKKKAEKILKEAKAGKDFTNLAKLYSDEPLSTTRGGDLGFFGKGEMDPEFEKAAFALDEGEISDLVRSSFGYHIITVEKKLSPGEVKPFEYVSENLKRRLERKKEKELALSKAKEIKKFIEEGAKDDKVEINKKTIFRNKAIEGIPNSGKFFNAAYSLDEGKVSNPVNIGPFFVVIKTLGKRPSHDGAFEEVSDKVAIDLKKERAFGAMEKKASSVVKMIKEGKSLNEVVKKDKIAVKSTGKILRREVPEDAIDREKFKALVFSLSEEKRADFSISQNGAYIVLLKGKDEIDQKEFESKKQSIRAKIIEERKNIIVSQVVANYRKNGDIEIMQDLL